MTYATKYIGKIPQELYLDLQNRWPQARGENDGMWVFRIRQDPDCLAYLQSAEARMFLSPELATDIVAAAERHLMAFSGATRTGAAHPGLVQQNRPPDTGRGFVRRLRGNMPSSDIAPLFRADLMTEAPDGPVGADDMTYLPTQANRSLAAALLVDLFDPTTPPDGSIFWNGINELALARMVNDWNTTIGHQVFGQLEATTAARYVNKRFEWTEGGAFQHYFETVSGHLGLAASGHVTAVVRCGLRNTSIFTTTELPNMLERMQGQLGQSPTPTVTDISIVVIEPYGIEHEPVHVFVNREMFDISQIRSNRADGRINGRDSCAPLDMALEIFDRYPLARDYLRARPTDTPSHAATRMQQDVASLTQWP
jgi:hypothetical protein